MTKDKSRDTIRVQTSLHNGKHNIPRRMLEVICKFKDMEFIQEVGIGRFLRSPRKTEGKIVGFSDSGKGYLVNVVLGGYEQKLYLRVESQSDEYEQRIKDVLTKL